MTSGRKQKHVVIVGGGAAGMSCAATLAQHPERFKITLLEKAPVCGGQAISIPIDEKKFGASWLNNGVQGGSPIFKHTFNFFRRYSYEPRDIRLQVSFGKGPDGFWTNCFRSRLVEKHAGDIKKFGYFLRLIKWTMPVLGLLPIRVMMRLMLFSKDFSDKMVYPLIALFLGTGNQTANVPCAIVERLFDDPNLRLWEYSPDTLLPNLPTMVTFDNLHSFYEAWQKDLESKGVEFRLRTEVTAIVSRTENGVLLRTKKVTPDIGFSADEGTHENDREEDFNELVLCVLADDALRLLGKQATFRERAVLGGAAFYDDVTVTHWDSDYFERHYETTFKADLCAVPKTSAQKEQVLWARGQETDAVELSRGGAHTQGFRPMYYTKSYQSDPKNIEMSFDASNYQHQLLDAVEESGEGGAGRQGGYEHVYQTIFLDKQHRNLWTIDEIDKAKIIKTQWWHQLGHRWQHYLRVVPGMMFLNGRHKTWFAGSWTLLNMHELACVSGIAAAYRLGAEYHKFDDFAEDFFSKYLLLSHGMSYSREESRRRKDKHV
ncbi:flavin-containing amine oxidasedehydrogenase-like protein [Thozetella sp. PMI_491]|nr:flavin-containing amine oxidasedehydrogenase-like protein [Thozetella sp. PMI_491]